jgi:hypothetical protein
MFCITLAQADPKGGRWTVSGEVPDGWDPPTMRDFSE